MPPEYNLIYFFLGIYFIFLYFLMNIVKDSIFFSLFLWSAFYFALCIKQSDQ